MLCSNGLSLVAVVYMPAIAMQGPSPEAALAWLGCITSSSSSRS